MWRLKTFTPIWLKDTIFFVGKHLFAQCALLELNSFSPHQKKSTTLQAHFATAVRAPYHKNTVSQVLYSENCTQTTTTITAISIIDIMNIVVIIIIITATAAAAAAAASTSY